MITPLEILFRLLLGSLLGGIIGFERQTHGRPAGFRTHILVCVASTLVMIVSEYYQYLGSMNPEYVRLDPARLAAGAITGIGFLGAGVIIKSGVNVQGLTTAASIWIVAAIGLATGSGLYFAATAAFIITFLSLWTLRIIERRMSRLSYKILTVVQGGDGTEEAVSAILGPLGLTVEDVDYERDMEKSQTTLRLTVGFKDKAAVSGALAAISSLPTVKRIHIGVRS